jgi:sorbitol-specific phosphotransferase system component IIC
MGQRGEALMRIPVAIVTGIILCAWAYLIGVFIAINFIWTIISGKRIKDLAELAEIWNTQKYTFFKYMIFLTNERPFPFTSLAKSISVYKK